MEEKNENEWRRPLPIADLYWAFFPGKYLATEKHQLTAKENFTIDFAKLLWAFHQNRGNFGQVNGTVCSLHSSYKIWEGMMNADVFLVCKLALHKDPHTCGPVT